jgi:hypothetical protein
MDNAKRPYMGAGYGSEYRGILWDIEESPYFKGVEMPDEVKMELRTYPMTDEMKGRLRRNYTYHAPKPDQIPRYEMIRSAAGDLAALLVTLCPPSRELSMALSALEVDVVMNANASIARNE